MRAQSPTATAPSERITELHLWAVREGLRRARQRLCSRISANGLLLPGYRFRGLSSGWRTLHPQWGNYTTTRRRGRDSVDPLRRERGEEYDQDLRDRPLFYLLNAAFCGGSAAALAASSLLVAGRNKIFQFSRSWRSPGQLAISPNWIPVGMVTGGHSLTTVLASRWATSHPEGFGNDDLRLIEAVLPAVSLAIMSDAEHTIAAGLLAAYLGGDVGPSYSCRCG